MSLLFTIAIVAFFVAQFTPKGQAFLATNRGAFATVALAAVSILLAIPGVLSGSLFSVAIVGLWCYIGYPRLRAARLGAKDVLRLKR